MVQERQTSKLRVASYNVRKTRGLDQRRNAGRTIAVINGLDAQIVALQEADLRLGHRPSAVPRDLIEAETDFRVVQVSSSEVSIGWHGNAILLHKSMSIRSISRIELPGLEPRGAVRIDLENGLVFSATHLGLLRRDRRGQLAAIEKALSDAPRAIVAGDFNEWRMKDGFEPLNARFDVLSPGHSFHAARPIAALDRIAFTRNLRLTDAGVDKSKLAQRASDHLPVWAELEWQSDAQQPPVDVKTGYELRES